MTSGLTERTWPSVLLSPILVSNHKITVSSTLGLKVKQVITLSKAGVTSQQFEIKRVFSSTMIMVGPIGKNIKETSEAVLFNGGSLAAHEQSRNKLGDAPIMRAVYEEEPTIALRTVSVDAFGNFFSLDNPIPVQLSDGSIEIGTVNAEIEVQLSHIDDSPNIGDVADSVRVGDGLEILEINPDGSINVVFTGIAPPGIPVNTYSAVTSVPSATTTTIATYTIPVGKSSQLDRIEFSGSNIGIFQVLINGTVKSTQRTWFNGPLSGTFEYVTSNLYGYGLVAGDIVKLQITHTRPNVGNFEGRIQTVDLTLAP